MPAIPSTSPPLPPPPPQTPLSRHRAFYNIAVFLHLLFVTLTYVVALGTNIASSTYSVNAIPTVLTLLFAGGVLHAAHDKRGLFRGSLLRYGVLVALLWYVMIGVNAVAWTADGGGVCMVLAAGNTMFGTVYAAYGYWLPEAREGVHWDGGHLRGVV